MRRTVLVVDDNPDARMIFAALLQYAGYAVLEAEHGEEGVQFAQYHEPDLIIMDLMMPVVTGWEATRRIKQDLVTGKIPIFGCTVYDLTPEEEARATHAGMERLIRKPVEPTPFIELVEARIGPPMGE